MLTSPDSRAIVDELRLIASPIVIGEGERLFGDGPVPRSWRLFSSTTTLSGAVAAVHARAGDLSW